MSKRKRKVLSASITLANVIGLGVVSVLAFNELRKNNKISGELYLKVQSADESGTGVYEALKELQIHVATHMNASPLPQLGDNAPIQLSKTYERARAAESARVTAERERVTQEGIVSCEAQFGTSRLTVRSQCIAEYGAAHPVQPEKQIVADLYRYDFVSPIWTPDRAGLLLVVGAVLACTLVLRLLSKTIASFMFKK